jgi:hypothetical protein
VPSCDEACGQREVSTLFQSWAEGRYPKEVAEAVCDRPLLALAGSNDSVLAAALDREEHQEREADRLASPRLYSSRDSRNSIWARRSSSWYARNSRTLPSGVSTGSSNRRARNSPKDRISLSTVSVDIGNLNQ